MPRLGVCAHMLNNTHILDFLDKRIFPFKDHKKQLSPFFSGRPLVNVVNHTRLGTEERKCHLSGPRERAHRWESSALGSPHCLLERETPDSHTQHPESGTRVQASPGFPVLWGNGYRIWYAHRCSGLSPSKPYFKYCKSHN